MMIASITYWGCAFLRFLFILVICSIACAGLQILGLLLTIVGIIIAFVNFDTPSNLAHRNIGITVLTIGFFQPLNAVGSHLASSMAFTHFNESTIVFLTLTVCCSLFTGIHTIE